MASLQHPSGGRAAAPLLAAGEVLAGRFRIVAWLGEGAIGEVYEAADIELEENVAVKVLRPEIARDGEVLHRFKREIQLARKVTHPNVCREFELFRHQGEKGSDLAFVTMELLRGETLEERLIRAGRMTTAEALPLVQQMAEGLHAAHQAGVVHRDFKTGNVMLVPSAEGPRAVVTDFGLAWSSSSASASVTRTGTILGSPAYMSPEQVKGEPVTPATDVYALGIVLYEMVTGSLPFSADTAVGTAIKRLREPPTMPRVHAPDLDRQWEAVILRCLESSPADRFATPVDVARALSEPRRVSGYTLRAVVRRRRKAGLVALAIAVLLTAVVGGWLARDRLLRSAAPPSYQAAAGARPAVAVLGFENLARDPDLAYIETSLVRMLPSELAAGERLRLVPSEQVDRARRDYGLAGGGSGLDRDTLERLRGRLGADFVIIGSYLARRRAGARGAERIRCVVAIQDAHSGAIIASLRQEGTEEGLLDLIDALGMQLRDHLGVGNLSPAEEVAARNARPANARAARLYAEGLEKLSRFETLAAKDLLEQARDADPDNALIRADLAAAWRTLGWPVPAAEAAREALRLSAGLGYESRRRVEARSAETTRDWKGAATLYGELWTRFPDDFEYGLGLARSQIQTGDTKAALLTVERLRASPQPWHDEPRIDLTEADAALRLGDSAHAVEIALRAERKAEAQGAPILAARALFFQGAGLRYLGRLVEAREAGERARERFQKAGDLASAAAALTTVGSVLSQQGENAAARRAFEETVAIGRAIGNEETSGIGLINIGVTRSESGDLEGARKSYEEALAIFRRIGSKPRVAMIAVNLARVDQRLGQRAQARALDEEMATTLRELGNRDSEATVLANLAVLALEEGKLKEASDLTSRALKLHQEIGGAAGVAEDRGLQGQVLALRGDLPAAQRELEAAAAGLTAGGEKLWAARLRIELARVLVEAGQPAEAEAMAHAALSALGGKPAPDDELAARTVLTLASLTQGHRDVAAAEVQRAAAPLAACQYQAVRLQAVLAAARVHAAAGQTQPAAGELRAVLAEAERTGLRPLALETRLALGELEGDGAARREQLSAAAREAAAAGYSGLARRAKAALSRGPS